VRPARPTVGGGEAAARSRRAPPGWLRALASAPGRPPASAPPNPSPARCRFAVSLHPASLLPAPVGTQERTGMTEAGATQGQRVRTAASPRRIASPFRRTLEPLPRPVPRRLLALDDLEAQCSACTALLKVPRPTVHTAWRAHVLILCLHYAMISRLNDRSYGVAVPPRAHARQAAFLPLPPRSCGCPARSWRPLVRVGIAPLQEENYRKR
jgi:hypothetical protein